LFQDPWVLYVTNAVISVGLALDQALLQMCDEFTPGPGYEGLCLKFLITGNNNSDNDTMMIIMIIMMIMIIIMMALDQALLQVCDEFTP
jgi:hypothetical protein